MTMMLLEWVFTSVFLILVVLGLRWALGKRISARLRYALWAVVLVRLLVPVQLFTSPLAGTWVVTEKRTDEAVDTPVGREGQFHPDGLTVVLDTGDGADRPALTVPDAPTLPDAPTAPEPPAAPDLTKAPAWLGWVWLGGSAAAALVLLGSNLRFARRLRRCRARLEGVDCPLPVYAAVGLPSPCLFGILRPAVYVTPETAASPDMLRHVTAHEYTHFRQGDHIWSLLRCAALAVHWWNPLVWLAVGLSRRDGELACDEGALRRLGDGERAAYGNTLLALVTAKPRPGDLLCFATTMAGDKKSLKERITRIAAAPRRWVWAAVAVVLATALACVCAFGQKAEGPGPGPSTEPSVEPSGEPLCRVTDFSTDLLYFEIEETETGPFVYLKGQVGEFEIAEGAYWCPMPAVEAATQGNVFLPDPPFGGGDGMIAAWWTDEGRTAVTITGQPAVEDGYAGWRVFTVEVDGAGGTVTESHLHGEEAGAYLAGLSDDEAAVLANLAARLLTAAEDYYNQDSSLPDSLKERVRGPLSDGAFDHARTHVLYEPDFNRNGIPETVMEADIPGDYVGPAWEAEGQRIGVFENGELIWWDEGYYAHAGYNAIFSCTIDGEEYLLRYNPVMYGGLCDYSYKLFTLEGNRETVVEQDYVSFDTNLGTSVFTGEFDPDAIGAFMERVNGLLAHSTIRMMTDQNLIDSIVDGQPGLEDNLWWLNASEPVFVRDEGKTLTENLRAFRDAFMGGGPAAFRRVLLGEEPFTLTRDGDATQTRKYLAGYAAPEQFATVWTTDGGYAVVLKSTYPQNGSEMLTFLYQEDGVVYSPETVLDGLGPVYARAYDVKANGVVVVHDSPGRDGATLAIDTAQGGFREGAVHNEAPEAPAGEAFYVDGQPATEGEYRATLEWEAGKPNAVWYDFTEENIREVFG